MSEYVGKVCPYCKAPFAPGDEIVVCSDCEMPHHKDCWVENQGCTTFGCTGTIRSAGGGASSVTTNQMRYDGPGSTVFCTKCGSKNDGSAAFCVSCGNRLTTAAAQTPPVYTQADPNNHNPYSYTGYAGPAPQPAGELEQLIGTKQEYYLRVFEDMRLRGKNTSWNWAAFLVTPYWLVYRKMYGFGIGMLAANLVLSMLPSGLSLLLSLVSWIAFGLYGNTIYKSQLESKVQQARAMAEPYKSQYIRQNGGVSGGAVGIAIGAMALIGLLL